MISSVFTLPRLPTPSVAARGFCLSARNMAAKDWSAHQYLKFEAERTRPSRDLLAQVPLESPKNVVDLGCGPGNSTAVLLSKYPKACVTGMDSSPDMIRKARTTLPNIEFLVDDLGSYTPKEPVDLFFSNAVFQWVPQNQRFQVIKRLIESQPPGGAFAFQVPDNLSEPSHVAMRDTAAAGPWAATLHAAGRDRFEPAQEIYDELKPLCADVNIWHTHYYHSLENHQVVVEWVKGTGLRPFVDPLSPEHKEGFLEAYLKRLRKVLPNRYTMLSWTHPHLTQSVDSGKGRQLQASQPIRGGEVLLIDPPYAIIPISSVESSLLLCSNPHCNTPVPQTTGTICCVKRCNSDVIWCTESCRATDKPRHDFECTWLAKYTMPLRSKWGEYNFGMLWLIVRILSRRHTELQRESDNDNDNKTDNKNANANKLPANSPLSHFKSGWPAIDALCGTTETWSHAQVREWTVLAKKYLSSSALPHSHHPDTVLGLICKEEANSFGLYPRETGHYPPPGPPVSRGEQFGAAVYPRASIANHSCCPNIIHKPDKHGRMIFRANRDIAPGEECCIAYFDMTRFVELKARREHLASLFRFKCGCPRCTAEEQAEQEEEKETSGLISAYE
ncbi:hypothetical protein BDV06DRAFT_210292 [Aspergillus oleicola]